MTRIKMDLTLSSDQDALLAEVSAFVREQMPIERLHQSERGDMAHVRTMGEMGWLGMSLPESRRGAGFTIADEALVFRELGRTLGPVSALAATMAAQADREGALLDVNSGAACVAIAIAAAPWTNDEREFRGAVRLFSNGSPAFAVFAHESGAAVFSLPDALEAVPCLDPGVEMRVSDFAALKFVTKIDDPSVLRHGLLLLSALNVGASEAARDLITEYAKVRTTFGRPIGAYQAVRHPIAEMAARAEQAKTQLLFAALALDLDREDSALQISALRALAQQAATLNADAAIQLHGAIGVTDEYHAHLFMKRAALFATWYGGAKAALKDVLHRPIRGI